MTKTQNKKRPYKIGKKGAAKESKLFMARREAQVIVVSQKGLSWKDLQRKIQSTTNFFF